MPRYLALIRGINVGGRNRVPMAELRERLKADGFTDVATYIASGNVLVASGDSATVVADRIERVIANSFALDVDLVRVKVLTRAQLRRVVDERPPGFGERPDTFHSDAIFLLDITAKHAMAVFDPREGIDEVWPGPGVIYSQRLSAERTRSRLSKIVGTPQYASMTIRNWRTTTKLLELMDAG